MNVNINLNNQPISLGSKARRLTRRLSYGLSKVLRDWNSDPRDSAGHLHFNEEDPRVFDIGTLINETKFSKTEIQFIYRDFKIKCPNGILTEKALAEIYSHIFSCGDTELFSKHLFSAMSQQVSNSLNKSSRLRNEINFKEFLTVLSTLLRGTLDDRIKWLFYFYDINRDGKISRDEIESLIRCLYDLMGPNVKPQFDDEDKNQHIENVINRLNLNLHNQLPMGYSDFYNLFSKEKDLIERMLNVY
ncbi:Kv channel-interacting 2-like [Brachionus plicatilis]|uniref:Kv channel-interacting 2-like n=1 Tax=Brachionus plicatilis TaxID=10195 RepID=A0A3M7RRX3_BRAPC|nr:Kv channel-interacting 2-like [Brachionus plicatilis]